MEKNRKYNRSSDISSSLNSSASGSSTYRNPAFQPQSLDLSKAPHQEKLFQGVPAEGPPASVYDCKLSASTPDLTTTSPYYRFQNHNNSNNRLRHQAWPQSDAPKRTFTQAYVNSAFSGPLECDQDSDTGECRTEVSIIPRPSIKYAYGDYDLSDDVMPPVESLRRDTGTASQAINDVAVVSSGSAEASTSERNNFSPDASM